MPMKGSVFVIGATGLVGDALLRALRRRQIPVAAATYHCHPSEDYRQLDIQDKAAVRAAIKELKPAVVALPAANPFVDYCQTHPAETRRVNVDGSLNVLAACAEIGARMVFFSSDYVFDGRRQSYGEDDPPSPLNEYGRQKAEVEAAVLSQKSGHVIIRTSGAYGWQWEPKNFVLQVLSRLKAGQSMKVACDIRYNPTSAENLAEISVDLAQTGAEGLFHVVGAERIIRYDFAKRVAHFFGLDESLLLPVPNSEFLSHTPRPKESALKTGKVQAAVKTPLMGIETGLSHMKAQHDEWLAYAKTRLPKPTPSI